MTAQEKADAISRRGIALATELLDLIGDGPGMVQIVAPNSAGTAGLVIACTNQSVCEALYELGLETLQTCDAAAVATIFDDDPTTTTQ